MADTKVSDLTAAATLDGSELLHIVQVGADRKATTAAIAGLITNEVIDDRVAALLQAGAGITITYNDASNTLTIASSVTQYTDEMVDDRVAALLQAGSGVTLTYNDASNTLTIAATGGSSLVAQNTQGGTAYTLAIDDAGKVVRCNFATAGVLTIPAESSVAFPIGTVISIRQAHDGQVTVTPAGSVVLNIPTGAVAKTRVKGSVLMIHKVLSDTWDLTGDLATS
jgi:ribulose bisphosphate carboxylase small subunit